ncbi:hypothetical protein [Alkalibacillus aidingensis]|uniref:hypothetical protein n=1 Tax=Alkalibacillus aidingensis TaxID=2747607 RepID=UPI0016601EAD|nr:hypothetical protein [Alkalibacillus aidingensis]
MTQSKSQVEWKQPTWFWVSIVLFVIAEYVVIYLLAESGMGPYDLLVHSVIYMTVLAYPIYVFVVMFLLPKELRLDVNTIFYILMPVILFAPNWALIYEYVNRWFI